MKILMLSPLWFPVARDSHGGIETYLPALTGALEKLGHDVSIIASGDSVLETGKIIPVVDRNLFGEMSEERASEYTYFEQHALMEVLASAGAFDVVHSHFGPSAYSLSELGALRDRLLHTHHTPVTQDLCWFVSQHPDLWVSTVSEFQARKLRAAGATRCTTIPNGIDPDLFTFASEPGDGLFFLGRMERSKGPDVAIELAARLERPITLAGPIVDPGFFRSSIKPRLGDQVRYEGVIDHAAKIELFGSSACVLLPVRGYESFGMVALESMSCGTPVVGAAVGALPEVIEHGVTGFVGRGLDELSAYVEEAVKLDRAKVRSHALGKFDLNAIAARFTGVYEEMSRLRMIDG
ncbi:MAG: glycosyltransferase [Actinomycetota bacterium]